MSIRALLLSVMLMLGALAACGGGSSGASGSSGSGTVTPPTVPTVPTTPPSDYTKRAAWLAARLGRPQRLLIGLGGADVAPIQQQGLQPDFYDQYLNGVGSGDWTTWNSPSGAYVQVSAQQAATVGALPMFTLYQMAAQGDGNLAVITNSSFMTQYWNNVRLLFQQLNIYGKPALVNFEPDFWGYTLRVATNTDPTTVAALVTINPDCTDQPNNVKGVAGCLIEVARKYAPNAYVGFPPSTFSDILSQSLTYMQNLGAGNADFVVMQTLDRDAGCFEAAPSYCQRAGSGWYWDESNQTSPNFNDFFALSNSFFQGLKLPLIFWQTPMGVPSNTPGGSDYHYRDNRVHYFLTHASQIVANGGFGVTFSPGETHQTSILTDGGQYQSLSKAYLAAPVALPQ